jgi:hypothetical protein
VNGSHRYSYCVNAPIAWSDSSGLCRVCNSGIRYRVSIGSLDAFTKDKAYSGLANTLPYLGPSWRANGLNVPVATSTGPYWQENDTRIFTQGKKMKLAFFLCFVDWDVCDDDGRPCRLLLNEIGSSTKFFPSNGRRPDGIEIDTGEKTRELGADNKRHTVESGRTNSITW